MQAYQSGIGAALGRNRLQQKDVAKALGLSRHTLLAWCHGRKVPTGTNLVRLVDYLRQFEPGVTAEDLVAPTTPAVGAIGA